MAAYPLRNTIYPIKLAAPELTNVGCGIRRVVLAAFSAHAVRCNKLGGHQANGVTKFDELAGPVVRA